MEKGLERYLGGEGREWGTVADLSRAREPSRTLTDRACITRSTIHNSTKTWFVSQCAWRGEVRSVPEVQRAPVNNRCCPRP